MFQPFSPIQNNILSKLKNAKSLRYSELMPEAKIANDLFNYHLQFLVKKGYLIKQDDGYSLSEIGVKHMADPFPAPDNHGIASLFKINVITIVSRIREGKIEILNQLRTSNPSYGKIGVMGGVVHKGEMLEQAAIRKLHVETGLEATHFRMIGWERRIMYVKDELFSDVLFPIAYTDGVEGDLRNTEFGENMWLSIDESLKHQEANSFDCIEAITTVLEAIKDKTIDTLPFFFTESVKRGDERP
jgi:8-oxo-dGTP pyrophosphatase MutT (NUDIX family)